VVVLAAAALAVTACGADDSSGSAASAAPATADPAEAANAGTPAADPTADPTAEPRRLRIGAIPDQDPEKLARLHGSVADYLASELGAEVEYVPVNDYSAAVTLFATGDRHVAGDRSRQRTGAGSDSLIRWMIGGGTDSSS
jgi:phosphonate transport system substrate-binding protein